MRALQSYNKEAKNEMSAFARSMEKKKKTSAAKSSGELTLVQVGVL